MKFAKMHGLGNDFVIIEDAELEGFADYSALAIKICDRHFGIGADGLIIIGPESASDIYMRIINSDGSEPEMCGNGIRCAAKYAWDRGLVNKTSIAVRTLAGIKHPEINIQNGQVVSVRVDMGEPILSPELIPINWAAQPVVGNLALNDGEFQITAVSMGNPHCVIFVEDLQSIEVRTWGPLIETHQLFPRRTNVEFVEIAGPHHLKMEVWERGAGETLACGTGACAALVAAVINGKTSRDARVQLQGGDLSVEWATSNNRVYMTGPAADVFIGEIEL